jgi:sugar/nucleoside kinase (ribokinase family)
MKKILAIGNALVDILIKLENDTLLQNFGLNKGSMQLADMKLIDTIMAQTNDVPKFQASGGSAANTIHGLAKLGVPTGYIGKVCNDDFGIFFKKDLESVNVKTVLTYSTTATGQALALVSPDSERTFATYLGAAVELGPDDITPEMFDGFDFLHIEGYLVYNHALMEKVLQIAKSKKIKTSLDMASYNVVEANRDFLKKLIIDYVDIIFANEDEAKAFDNKTPAEALNDFTHITEIAVVKLGKDGSLVGTKDGVCKIPGIKANAIDTTGAGDLYAAGFLFGLMNGMTLDKCGKIGSLLGANVVELIGAKIDENRWEQIKKNIPSL